MILVEGGEPEAGAELVGPLGVEAGGQVVRPDIVAVRITGVFRLIPGVERQGEREGFVDLVGQAGGIGGAVFRVAAVPVGAIEVIDAEADHHAVGKLAGKIAADAGHDVIGERGVPVGRVVPLAGDRQVPEGVLANGAAAHQADVVGVRGVVPVVVIVLTAPAEADRGLPLRGRVAQGAIDGVVVGLFGLDAEGHGVVEIPALAIELIVLGVDVRRGEGEVPTRTQLAEEGETHAIGIRVLGVLVVEAALKGVEAVDAEARAVELIVQGEARLDTPAAAGLLVGDGVARVALPEETQAHLRQKRPTVAKLEAGLLAGGGESRGGQETPTKERGELKRLFHDLLFLLQTVRCAGCHRPGWAATGADAGSSRGPAHGFRGPGRSARPNRAA